MTISLFSGDVAGAGATTPTVLELTTPQLAEVSLVVAAVTGTLTVNLVSGGLVRDTLAITSPGEYTLAGDVRTNISLSWTSTTATLTATALTVTAYCSEEDVTSYAVAGRAIEEISLRERCRARLAASAEVDAALNAGYVPPILEWGVDVRRAAAQLTAAQLFTVRGTDMQGADAVVFDAGKRAAAWLASVAAGRIRPPGLVDSTPEVSEFGLAIASRTSRRWDP